MTVFYDKDPIDRYLAPARQGAGTSKAQDVSAEAVLRSSRCWILHQTENQQRGDDHPRHNRLRPDKQSLHRDYDRTARLKRSSAACLVVAIRSCQ
jgi:hypothetical protein